MQSIRNIPYITLLVLSGLLFFSKLRSQNNDPHGILYTPVSGLSHSRVTTVMQDSLGFLWIGTREGLNKFDGYSFEQYRYQPDTISLSNNHIRCIAEGNNGVLWVGTEFGLSKLDRMRGYLWTTYQTDATLMEKRIYSLLVDTRGFVWIRTGKSLISMDPENGSRQHFPLYENESRQGGLEDSYSMFMDEDGKIWMGTKDGLQVFDPGSEELNIYFRDEKVSRVLRDSGGRLWCGADKGLFLYLEHTDSFMDAGEFLPALKGTRVSSIIENHRGDLLVGDGNRLISIDEDLENAVFFNGYFRPDVYTRFSDIASIYEDPSHILWLGTGNGLVKIDQKGKKFQLTGPPMVSSILQDDNGDLWIGTDGMGIRKMPAGASAEIQYSSYAGLSSRRLDNDVIHSILRDSQGDLWIGTGNGVSVMQEGSVRFRPFCSGKDKIMCSVFDREDVFDILEDASGKIWFAASNGIHRYDAAEKTMTSVRKIHHGDEVVELNDVYCIEEDRNGIIWIGSDAGLIRYQAADDKYDIYQAGQLYGRPGINSNSIFSLLAGGNGELWIGTASGLNRYDPEKKTFEFIGDPVELSELRIYGILDDSEGKLWLSTERGMSWYDPVLETYIQYGTSDGLQKGDFLRGSAYKNQNGRLFFGGTGGLNSFHPDSIEFNPHRPKLSFTQFVRFREQGGMSKPLALDRVSTVIVPRGVEIVTIRFSALEFTAPERNRYMYRMVRKGQDGLWVHNGEQHYVSFYRLNPGTYTLSVKGSNNDLLYSEEEIHMDIVIPFPFWNKSLAILLYVAAGAIVMFILIRIRTRSLRRSNRILREKEISAMEIDRQRHELARKNKNITDSINYARRIQHALLPTDESFQSLLPDSFVLFKPKDIVSGDFYWINQHGNKIYVAAVDCTGHGVPGAFVSIIGFELFRKITTSEQGSNPAMILDTLNDNFTDIFSDGEQVYLNDGMDLSLVVIDRKEKSLDFSGAFNPLYLVRDETVIEVKADRFSVGADVHFSAERKLFKSHKIFLQKGDIFYLFSDGYADQFGGPEGKKFKYRRFRHLLLTIHKLPMEKQRSILDASIEEWKGDFDQVDDILVIGIRP